MTEGIDDDELKGYGVKNGHLKRFHQLFAYLQNKLPSVSEKVNEMEEESKKWVNGKADEIVNEFKEFANKEAEEAYKYVKKKKQRRKCLKNIKKQKKS